MTIINRNFIAEWVDTANVGRKIEDTVELGPGGFSIILPKSDPRCSKNEIEALDTKGNIVGYIPVTQENNLV